MKIISLMVLMLLVLPAQAKFGKNWVKVWDGTYAYCNSKSDTIRYRNQVYSIRNEEVSLSDDIISLNLDMVFFSCSEKESNIFSLESVNPFDEYSYTNGILPDVSNDVRVNTEWIEVVVYRDGVYKPLVSKRLVGSLQIAESFLISDLLTVEEQDRLNDGEKVEASFDFMINRSSIYTVNEESELKKVSNYGSFRRWLSFENNDDTVTVKKIIK